MKLFKSSFITALLALIALAAPAQVTPTTIFSLTNLPSYISTNTTTNLFTAGTTPTNNIISVRQGQGFATSLVLAGTNAAATGNCTINWATSIDGTNYSTTGFIQTIAAENGTSQVIEVTNFPSTVINNVLYVTPYSIQNATTAGFGGIYLSNLTLSFGNLVPGGYP